MREAGPDSGHISVTRATGADPLAIDALPDVTFEAAELLPPSFGSVFREDDDEDEPT